MLQCFLDTPELLNRQMVAHGMDAWSREDEGAGSIPPQVRYIKNVDEPSKFPGRFLNFYQKNRTSLTESFLKRFSDELSPDNQKLLEDFGDSDAVQSYVMAAFDRVRAERADLTYTRKRISNQIGHEQHASTLRLILQQLMDFSPMLVSPVTLINM